MFKLSQKLSLGFGGLLLIMIVIGGRSILLLSSLGSSIDIILRENYRSVVACQEMKESLERMDSGILFVLLGEGEPGRDLIRTNERVFADALQAEINNITLPEEGEKARSIESQYELFRREVEGVIASERGAKEARDIYFGRILPLFQKIKGTADEILRMNQQNMNDRNDGARSIAMRARRQMYALLLGAVLIGAAYMLLIRRSILRPIRGLISSAEEIKKGNLELAVESHSRDEIGLLSETFNEMAASLRRSRRIDQIRFARIREATEQAVKNLPEAVAILDVDGDIEVSTEAAQSSFGLEPRKNLKSLPFAWMREIHSAALRTERPSSLEKDGGVVQHFAGGIERFIRPKAVPILDGESRTTGVIMILKDVTVEREQEELKRGLIATVSHQLKTPLASVRMALHILLEENVGTLNAKQAELLIAARDDSFRLHSILNSLLDISRMEADASKRAYRAVAPAHLASEALDPFLAGAKDKGVVLRSKIPDDLPDVWADPDRIQAVFANLVSNALRFTDPGGRIDVGAEAGEEFVTFSIADTGKGIPPQYLDRIFERFFQVPGTAAEGGVGLGLAIVKEVVESHGGTVGVDSRVGEGSVFTFSLKRADRVPSGNEAHP